MFKDYRKFENDTEFLVQKVKMKKKGKMKKKKNKGEMKL